MKIHLLVKTVLLLSLYILPLPHRSCLLLSLRKHQFLLALRRWERFAAKSEEKQMFSHATYVCSQSRCCKEFGLLFNIQQNQGFWYLWWWKFSYLIANHMWSHTEFEFDLKKSQVHVWFQTQIARHEIQLPFYYSHFEIAEFSEYQYFIDQWAGLSKSGNKKAFASHFVCETEMMRYGAKMVRCWTWLTRFGTDVI